MPNHYSHLRLTHSLLCCCQKLLLPSNQKPTEKILTAYHWLWLYVYDAKNCFSKRSFSEIRDHTALLCLELSLLINCLDFVNISHFASNVIPDYCYNWTFFLFEIASFYQGQWNCLQFLLKWNKLGVNNSYKLCWNTLILPSCPFSSFQQKWVRLIHFEFSTFAR